MLSDSPKLDGFIHQNRFTAVTFFTPKNFIQKKLNNNCDVVTSQKWSVILRRNILQCSIFLCTSGRWNETVSSVYKICLSKESVFRNYSNLSYFTLHLIYLFISRSPHLLIASFKIFLQFLTIFSVSIISCFISFTCFLPRDAYEEHGFLSSFSEKLPNTLFSISFIKTDICASAHHYREPMIKKGLKSWSKNVVSSAFETHATRKQKTVF